MSSDFETYGIKLVKYNGNAEEAVIPEGIKKIGDWAFYECSNIKKIIIPEGTAEIGYGAFSGCADLEYATIPAGVKEIGDLAFSGCSSLKSLTIPDSVAIIGHSAFRDCPNLESITIPNGVIEIGWYAFEGCAGIESITIPEGAAEIGNSAFAGCISLKNVNIPDTVTKIGESAFSRCESLERVIIPGSVSEIGSEAFKGCSKIKNAELPRSIKKLEPGNSHIFTKKPSWLPETDRILCAEIIKLLKENWLNQMTARDWAALYLTQTAKSFKKLFKKRTADKPNIYLSAMIDVLKKRGKGAAFTRAAEYAAEYNRELDRTLIDSLYELTKSAKGTKKAIEILEPIANPKEIDKNSPYARLYESFDEPKLLKHYKEHKGRTELLSEVKTADGKEAAPQIAVLAAVVPYLDDADCKMLPASDKAAELLDRKSLMDLIKTGVKSEKDDEWLKIYCRCGSESDIQSLIKLRKSKTGKYILSYYKNYLPKEALLLSDTKSAAAELYRAEKYRGPILEEYAGMRNITKDALLDEVLPDIGLDENGVKIYDLGNLKVSARLMPGLKLDLFNEQTGRYIEAIPKTGADTKKYKTAIADFAETNKLLKGIVSFRFEYLLDCFLSAREWSAEHWQNANLKNPINRQIAELLIWEQEGATFTVKDKMLIDNAGKEVALTDKTIKLAHPMEMKKAVLEEWKKYFAENKLNQPFAQIWEPFASPEKVKTDRYSGVKLSLVDFLSPDNKEIAYNSYRGCNKMGKLLLNFKDCLLYYNIESKHPFKSSKDDKIKLGDFTFKKYSRRVNHIVSILDKWTIIERIKKDDMSVMDLLDNASAAQLADYTKIAIENGAKNLTAKLLKLKKERFPEFDGIEEFTLGDW